ncbi:hypothetical protein XM38_022170 [Halomicronema hongdechloris C2206]|uniref:STAS/SEC14 domain-containing protein n=1 Tax=Halomicronema hongdechloris C2206 TaxID=1641165 RepID=A0A1Z3HLW3_9CYAN|nr:hypothetical protein [Halomicronema hongdechloris]ASC71265.1 hypothetical protein XM38_022170 [Halomicronema hongdechloris C2206]
MPFTVTYNTELAIVETIFFGLVSADEAAREIVESHQLAVEKDCRLFFTDLSRAELQLSLVDVYGMPDTYEKMGWERRVRIAFIPPSGDEGRHLAEFYETVGVNRGWTVKIFSNKQQAVQWLIEDVE